MVVLVRGRLNESFGSSIKANSHPSPDKNTETGSYFAHVHVELISRQLTPNPYPVPERFRQKLAYIWFYIS